jgi:chaperonin GroES
MKVKPLADRVLVKLEKSETKSAGGIIIPDTAQEKTQIGAVVDVGEGDEKNVIRVKAGQKVMYDKYAGTQVKINGEDHLILKMSDILAIIEYPGSTNFREQSSRAAAPLEPLFFNANACVPCV